MNNCFKFFFFFIFSISLLSCGSSKQTEQVVEAIPNYDNEGKPEALARDFASAIISNNKSLLEKYEVNISTLRLLMPPKDQSNEMLENLISDRLQKRDFDLQNIQKDIEAKGVDRAKLKYKDYIYHNEETDDPKVPKVLEVILDNAGEEVHIPITVTELHGKWYMFEILNSVGLFN